MATVRISEEEFLTLAKRTMPQEQYEKVKAELSTGSSPQSKQLGKNVAKGGRRADLDNRYFRSSYEANFARYCNFMGIKWEYESKVYEFPGVKRGAVEYRPDFWLPDEGKHVEVKGHWTSRGKAQFNRFRKFYPEIPIELITEPFFREICKKKLCRLISPHYECNCQPLP